MKRSRNRVGELLRELSGWESSELRELQAALGGLLEAQEPDAVEGLAKENGGVIRGQRGHIEEKYIPRGNKRHGPYLYLRYWQDGKLRSKYLGKKNTE